MDIQDLYDRFVECHTVGTDSRHIAPEEMFFALHGASFDGNAYAIDALQKGARYAVIDSEKVYRADNGNHTGLILVEDTLHALQQLAALHRQRLAIPIIGIVGSNGKTTTKELTRAVLSAQYRVQATEGNLNNHIGVPLTLLAMDTSVKIGIVEMGASAQGEIAALCRISQPNFGLITNIGRSHLEGFGGVEGIRKGKGEMFDYLAANGGRAFVPREDEVLVEMSRERVAMAVTLYSRSMADNCPSHLEGDYNHNNIAAAMAVGEYFEVSYDKMRAAIADYIPSNHRSQRLSTARNTVIADCYNANPSSMQAAIENIAKEPAAEKLLILGDMLELGTWSAEEHRRVAAQAAAVPNARVWFVGKEFAMVDKELHCAERVFASSDEVAQYLTAHPATGVTVLLKGSHGIALEKLIGLF